MRAAAISPVTRAQSHTTDAMLSCGRPSPRYVEVEDNPDEGRCCGLPVLSSMGGEGTLDAAASRFGGAGGVRDTIRRGGGGPSRDTICGGGGSLMGSPNRSRGNRNPTNGKTPNLVSYIQINMFHFKIIAHISVLSLQSSFSVLF